MHPVLEQWKYQTGRPERAIVIADGCRDLIVQREPEGADRWFLSPLQDCARTVELGANVSMTGYRLRPGVLLDEAGLQRRPAAWPVTDGAVADLLAEHCRVDPRLDDAIRALSCRSATIAATARILGVSLRTLERLFAGMGVKPPGFWHRLGRARRVAAGLSRQHSLADAATEAGYADQAHMTREFKRWFDLTPAQIRSDQSLRAMIDQTGLGTESTLVQTSTR